MENENRTASRIEEFFVVDMQILLHEMMEDKGVTRAELARRMNVTRSRISQMFSHECTNLTVRNLARCFEALGEFPELVCEWTRNRDANLIVESCAEAISESSENLVWFVNEETNKATVRDKYKARSFIDYHVQAANDPATYKSEEKRMRA